MRMHDYYIDRKRNNIYIRKGSSCGILMTVPRIRTSEGNEVFCDFIITKKHGTEPIIQKTFKVFFKEFIEIELNSNETDKLAAGSENKPNIYLWGLVLHDKEKTYCHTIIPWFDKKAEFRVYPGLELCS